MASLLAASNFLLGQRCGYTDTIAIDAIGETDITISIENYLNNDLSDPDQGLCGISLYFQHSYVYDLSVSVTSPAGQTVEFIGPVNAQTRPPTNLARWFIDFLACDSTAAPDAGATGQWNNNSGFNWPAFGLFQGDYFPATGCFSDLNTGPVNGDWTITFNNSRTGQQGRATYLLLTFCDDANSEGPCCFANAGELETEPLIETCEFPDDLPLSFPPRYRQPRPDADLYGYTYLIARNDSVLFTQDDINLAGFPAAEYEICGLSYREGELPLLPLDGSFEFDQLRQDFADVQPTLCADLTPVCQLVRLLPPPDTTFMDRIVCTGGSVTVGTEVYNTTGVFPNTLVDQFGCDSVVVLDLQVVQVLRETVDTTICAEGFFSVGQNDYVLPGNYVDTIPSVLGCDSIVTLNLDVADPIRFDTTLSICAGDTFFVGEEPFFESIIDSRRIQAVNGCDSFVQFNLRVLSPEIGFSFQQDSITCRTPVAESRIFGANVAFTQSLGWFDAVGNRLSSSFVLEADTAGTYFFELVVGSRGTFCTVEDSITVTDYRFDITADLAPTQVQCTGTEEQCAIINCRNPVVGILATPSPAGPAYRYQWAAPPGGNITSADNVAEITVDAPGRYDLMITDPVTGCRFDTFFVIGIDTLQPSLAFFGHEILNCETAEINLIADTFQLRNDELEYVWTGDCLPAAVAGPSLRIDCPGMVTLTVTNQTNGCSRDTSFLIEEDLAPVNFSLAPAAAPINCFTPTQTLDGSGSSSANGLLYAWTLNGGADTIGRDPTLLIDVPGDYRLFVVDQRSRCFAEGQVTVPGDTLRPNALSGPQALTLNCFLPDTILGDAALPNRPTVEYAWVELSNPLDTIGLTAILPVSPPGGAFRLTAYDPLNGCRTADSTLVITDFATPFLRIAEPLDFDCFTDSIVLDATQTNLSYPNTQSWSGPCVPTQTDTNRLAVYCPGTYFYTVTNLESGCSETDSVRVNLAANGVVAILPDTAFLDCDTGETRLDRRLGTDAPVVRWFRDGTPVNLVGQQPRVTVPGVYTLVLGNFNESCLDTARTVVTANCPVLSIIVPPDSITCVRSFVELDATNSFPISGAGQSTEWLIPAGAVAIVGLNPRTLRVFTPGRFGFVIRNLVDGSVDTSYVDVVRNQIDPIADAGPRDTINCYQPEVELDAGNSQQGPLLDYLWTNTSGDTIGTTQQVNVSTAGPYLLTVTQRETGCDAVDNVLIRRDTDVPGLTFSAAQIPCDTVDFAMSVLPDESGEYTYAWSGPAVLAQSSQDTVRIADVGVYVVTVTDLSNGCPAIDSVSATRLPCPPFPFLADTSLTCKSDTLRIAPTFRDPCEGCTYRWLRNGSPMPGQQDSILPVIREGVYAVIATNVFGLTDTAFASITDARILPESNAGPDRTLTCDVTSIVLGNNEEEPDFPYSYQWLTSDGTPIPGATNDSLSVSMGGEYQLLTTNLFSECIALDTVLVGYDTIPPVANAGTGRLLDCNNKRRTLDGIRSSLGNRFAYSWSGGGSELCLEGSTTLNPIVRCGGTYTITVRDTLNGCTASATTFVEVDDELPNLIPLADTTLNCNSDSVLLVGRDISSPNLLYGWEEIRSNGNLPVAESSPGIIRVGTEGNFRFSATNTISGCDNSFDVAVSADLIRPIVNAGLSDTFFCALDSLPVIGTASTASGRPLLYSWNSGTGFFVSESDSLRAHIFQPDTYYLTATDVANSCSTTDSVFIFRDTEAPVAFAGMDTTLTCDRNSLTLNGGGTTLSGQADFFWTTRDGNILTGSQTLTPLIDQEGRYQINITDPVNDCSGADIVRVSLDTLRPAAAVNLPAGNLINCFRPQVEIQGLRPITFSGGVDYSWLAPDQTVSSERTIIAADSGAYRLIVTGQRNACADTTSVSISADFAAPISTVATPLPITCIRDSVRLTPTTLEQGVRYRWLTADGDGIVVSDELTVGATGLYLLESLDQRNGCRDTVSTFVSEDQTPPVVMLADPLALNCSREFATIDGTGSSRGPDFVRQWDSPGNTAVATADLYQVRGSVPGFYSLTVSNRVNGCSTVDSVELLRSALAVDDLALEVIQPTCLDDPNGDILIMGVSGGTPPFRYRLDDGLLTDRLVYEGLPVGRYEVEVVGADGCSVSQMIDINPGPEVMVDLREDTVIRLGDSLPLNFTTNILNWDTLIWSSSGPLPSVSSDGPITVAPQVSQGYRLVVVGADGCLATDNVIIEVDETVNVYVPTAFSPNGDDNNDKIRPFFGPQVERLLSFRVYDRWGEQVYDLESDPERGGDFFGWDGNLDGKPLNPQVFIWQLEIELVDGTVLQEFGDFVLLR